MVLTTVKAEARFFKVGAQLFAEEGPSLVEDLRKSDKKVFLDLKFHDIPNTVAGGVRAAMRHGAHMLTVHASGVLLIVLLVAGYALTGLERGRVELSQLAVAGELRNVEVDRAV